MSSKPVPHMATIKATAKLFGLPEHFIRQLVLSGKVVAVKAGCKYLVNTDRLTEFLNTSKIEDHPNENEVKKGITPIPANL